MSSSDLTIFKGGGSKLTYFAYATALILIIALSSLLVLHSQDELPERTVWITIGIIGIWRYSWKLMHAIRAVYYIAVRYPRIKFAATGAIKPSQLLVIITSYRIEPLVNFQVYKHLFDELEKYGVESRVAACITDPNDIDIIEKARNNRNISVTYLPQDGAGKRVAMVEALRMFHSEGYSENAQLVLMDGDTMLSDDIFNKSCPFLSRYKDLGALTCHNAPLVKGSELARQWYRQRMSMRHFYMSSLSLSHRLLVLTGRFSIFKAKILINKEFMHILEHDIIDHWRYGKLKMLTGDDKSSWFYLLKYRWRMIYLPDVVVNCLEDAPHNNFFVASISLMKRWYGNMLRNNGRALKLGWRECGFFLWLCLLDQRISILTTLTGPIVVFLFSLAYSPVVFAAYIIWIILGRGVNCIVVGLLSKTFHPAFIFLLWYEQIIGSALKVYVYFSLDRQKWTRQEIKSQKSSMNMYVGVLLPRLMMMATVLSLILLLGLYHGVI